MGISFLDSFLWFNIYCMSSCARQPRLGYYTDMKDRRELGPALTEHSGSKVLWGKIVGSKWEWLTAGPRLIWAKEEGFREEVALKQETEGWIGVGQVSVCVARNWRGVLLVCLESYGIRTLQELREVQCVEIESEDGRERTAWLTLEALVNEFGLYSKNKEKLLMAHKQKSYRLKFAFQKDHPCFGVENGIGGK